MTYATERARVGREPITVVELDLDFCSLTYGSAPCTAAVGVTGTQKCFNTKKTCQDTANYDPVAKTYRFSDTPIPLSNQSIPSILSITTAPTRIDPGKGLGLRASVTVTFQDEPFTDTFGIDKYVATRSYIPYAQGTYWGKLLARNPYYQGRIMRVRMGYLGTAFSFSNFEDRTYVIESISGPDASGKVKVTAKDVLKLADDDRSQCPAVSTGKLIAGINSAVLSATLSPTGIGDDEYPASGYAAMGSEIVSFTRAADVLTIVRAQYNTTAAAHSLGDVVQLCKLWTSTRVDDIVYELMVDFAGVDPAFITFTDWQDEADAWLNSHNLTTIIPKPMGVNKLLTELSQQCLFYTWWDERDQEVKFKAIHPPVGEEAAEIDETSNILEDSASITEKPDERLSQAWVYSVKFNPMENEEVKNFSQLYVTADLSKEDSTEYNESRVKVITSRWFTAANLGETIILGARLLAKYKDNPKTMTLKLDAKDADIWTGDLVYVTSKVLQNPDGSKKVTLMQVLSVQESAGTLAAYELTNSYFQGRYGFVTEDSMVDYALATDSQKQVNGFIGYDAGNFLSDGGEPYKII